MLLFVFFYLSLIAEVVGFNLFIFGALFIFEKYICFLYVVQCLFLNSISLLLIKFKTVLLCYYFMLYELFYCYPPYNCCSCYMWYSNNFVYYSFN